MDNFIISNRIQFSKYAKSYDKYAKFQHEVGLELLSELKGFIDNKINLNINNILDLGSGTGSNFDKLLDITKAKMILELDHSEDMLKVSKKKKSNKLLSCCADMHNLPFSNDFKFDLVFSNLAMQWCLNLDKLLLDISSLLSKNGVLVFSSVLSGSLGEISESLKINNFLSKDQVLNMLSSVNNMYLCDFKYKKITRKFDSLFELFASVKKVGAAHVMQDIKNRFSQGLMTPRKMDILELTWPKDKLGRFKLSYNIGYFIYEKK